MIQNVATTPQVDLIAGLVECLSADAAQRIVNYRISDQAQAKLDEWAEKNKESLITPEEKVEYEYQVRVLQFISILQAKAKNRLKLTQHLSKP